MSTVSNDRHGRAKPILTTGGKAVSTVSSEHTEGRSRILTTGGEAGSTVSSDIRKGEAASSQQAAKPGVL